MLSLDSYPLQSNYKYLDLSYWKHKRHKIYFTCFLWNTLHATMFYIKHCDGVRGKPCIYMGQYFLQRKANRVTQITCIFGRLKNNIHTFVKLYLLCFLAKLLNILKNFSNADTRFSTTIGLFDCIGEVPVAM